MSMEPVIPPPFKEDDPELKALLSDNEDDDDDDFAVVPSLQMVPSSPARVAVPMKNDHVPFSSPSSPYNGNDESSRYNDHNNRNNNDYSQQQQQKQQQDDHNHNIYYSQEEQEEAVVVLDDENDNDNNNMFPLQQQPQSSFSFSSFSSSSEPSTLLPPAATTTTTTLYGDENNKDTSLPQRQWQSQQHATAAAAAAEEETALSSATSSSTSSNSSSTRNNNNNHSQDVIDLLDDSGDDDNDDQNNNTRNNNNKDFQPPPRKRQKRINDVNDNLNKTVSAQPGTTTLSSSSSMPEQQAFYGRQSHLPNWMKQSQQQRPLAAAVVPTTPTKTSLSSSLRGKSLFERLYGPKIKKSYDSMTMSTVATTTAQSPSPPQQPKQQQQSSSSSSSSLQQPYHQYFRLPSDFVPTWKQFLPITNTNNSHSAMSSSQQQQRRFQLTLLNVNEFTIEGLPVRYEGPPTSIMGLRVPIRKISKAHGGKAIFNQSNQHEDGTPMNDDNEKRQKKDNHDDDNDNHDDDDENVVANHQQRQQQNTGRWHIPLAAYHAFVAYLTSSSCHDHTNTTNTTTTHVIGIPDHQLQIASLERERQEKGWPSVHDLCQQGVPKGLAMTLAPFQRGGVDFVLAKNGRALIADEMGLGKTVQAIASMSVYVQEWPLLVLTPSTARYHWEIEFVRWLGFESPINKETDTPKDRLIYKSQIHVLTSSRDEILPNATTRVVICSYGLAPTLAEIGSLRPGQFKCAIVDESHMLKNKSTKRTASLTPVLQSTKRCVLLSGTPAMARPAELWPQLTILGTEQHGWWENETEFLDRYVKHGTSRTRAELHALLTGTVMIRRLKNDILSSMKPKIRQKVQLSVLTRENQTEFKDLLLKLRQGKGQLAKLARANKQEQKLAEQEAEAILHASEAGADGTGTMGPPQNNNNNMNNNNNKSAFVDYNIQRAVDDEEEKSRRSNILSRLYNLTGEAKVSMIADMLNRWLDDPTKGKVCIFAHHLNVLDAISELAHLSNDDEPSSQRKFIRIDGSTMPRSRQEQISMFQSDSTIRVAMLGITAAGVAVTLTASSTVWFAELFWTPAIMIQAEDRCHRIGQQGQVECVYFVGRGTLDELLWKLVEKKFRQLGEFVEGRDKEKMVIHKTFKSTKEFQSIFESKESLRSEVEADTSFGGGGGGTDEVGPDSAASSPWVSLDDNLELDIAELGEDERRMLKSLEAPDEEEGDSNINSSSSSSGNKGQNEDSAELTSCGRRGTNALVVKDDELGSSQEAAITLSDDEEETSPTSTESTSTENNQLDLFHKPLVGCRLYRLVIPGRMLGFAVLMLNGRAVVSQKDPTTNDMGTAVTMKKPAIGDVLVMIGNMPLHLEKSGVQIHHMIQKALKQQPPVQLSFAEDPEIHAHIYSLLSLSRTMNSNSASKCGGDSKGGRSTTKKNTTTKAVQPADVIELLE